MELSTVLSDRRRRGLKGLFDAVGRCTREAAPFDVVRTDVEARHLEATNGALIVRVGGGDGELAFVDPRSLTDADARRWPSFDEFFAARDGERRVRLHVEHLRRVVDVLEKAHRMAVHADPEARSWVDVFIPEPEARGSMPEQVLQPVRFAAPGAEAVLMPMINQD